MLDYTSIPALAYVVLEESWVLGISARPGVVEFEMDLTFAKDHPELKPPRAGDMYYGRTGTIQFTGVTSLTWSGQGAPPAIDANGAHDYDAIDSFQWHGTIYTLDGSWGAMRIDAADVEVTLTGPA
ncbi:hypothetical protein [Humibacter sp. RRB41]|uniref:hypothetical protein n=1 Tax=Humibacter sp. RRB41 TaxID=2919946 RepID=UPI001FA96E25|nr:hypothetical protein [Humibacter sp. RRB41]